MGSGRAVGGIVFLAYDAGGHDEYMEIHQTFFTDNTLFLLVWNLAPRPADGQDMAALTAQMAEELVASRSWRNALP